MGRLGSTRGPVARLNDQVLRLVGVAFTACGAFVTAASLTTDAGLAVPDPTTNTVVADLGSVAPLVAFALAHPAYPALLVAGLVLVALGEDTPLLGS